MHIINYIKVAIRSLLKYRSDAIINVLGLSIGVTISIIVLIYVRYELNYDKSFSFSEQTYRINTKDTIANNQFESALSPMPLSNYLRQNYSEIVTAVKLYRGANKLISFNDKKFNEDNFFYADSTFFDIFDVPFVLGDPKKSLTENESVVITDKTAHKYFGKDNPLGKELHLDNGLILKVTAVCKPMPANSHFHFDFIANQNAINKLYSGKETGDLETYKNNWLKINWYTYLVLNKKTNPNQFITLIQSDLKDKINQQVKHLIKDSINDLTGINDISFSLQPLEGIHLHSKIDDQLEPNSKNLYVILFVFIAIFMIIITSINFINLTTAKISHRLNEIAIKKLAGASRKGLFSQFVTEAITYSFIALFLGLVSVELLLPGFNSLFDLHLKFNSLENLSDVLYIILLTLLIGISSGIYPAISLSGFQIITIFKNRNQFGKTGLLLRGSLTGIQIMVATFLIILTLGMYWQLTFLKNIDLGFNSKNILVVERGYSLGTKFTDFKNELIRTNGIEGVSACSALPGEKSTQASFNYTNKNGNQMVLLPTNFVERDFFKVLGINFQAGNIWDETKTKMAPDVVLNSQAKSFLNLKRPLGQKISFSNSTHKDYHYDFSIRGIAKDFYFEPIQFPLRPLILMDLPKGSFYDNLLIKLSEKQNLNKTIIKISNTWKKYTNNEPFEYKILEDTLKNNLAEETKVMKIVFIFMLLSLFVAWLGLRAFASYTRELKDEEFQIKKINGASPKQIFTELFYNISVFVVMGIILAIPISYIVINVWLKGFAYSNRLPITLIMSIAGIIWGVSFLLILIHSFKSIKSNPISNN